ncbi:hypothetical protein SteCoe_16267 [Stentor coeruleus]|uniref:Uncharacterized protein n=1 Tax=Stentor coeruleus TaxID=5963 RepID=A0A1R2C1K0_9CILI|nr:hypothetical protein SteCoe_16267 [Stentor coeruleus]
MEPNDSEITSSTLSNFMSPKEKNVEGVSLKKITLEPFLSGLVFGIDGILEEIPTESLSWGKYCVYSVLRGLGFII